MSIVNSLASIEEDPPSERTSTFVPEASSPENDANRLDDIKPLGKPIRQGRWKFRFRRRADRPSTFLGRGSLKTFSCGCGTRTLKRSNQIQLASFVELLGCLTALICGMFYIGSTFYFYEVDISPEKREQVYDEKLERAVFLEKTRIGIVGLLTTCVVGVMISMCMAVGICCKSWSSFRAALTLLFSVNIFHFLLAIIYLPRGSNLIISIVAIPIRIYEFILIRNHIRHHKRKRFAALQEKVRRAGGSVMATSAVGKLGRQYSSENISLCSFEQEELMKLGELRKSDTGINCIYNCLPSGSRRDIREPVLDTVIMSDVQIGTGEQPREDPIRESGVPKGELVIAEIKNRPQRQLQHNDWKRDKRAVSRLATAKYTFNQYDILK